MERKKYRLKDWREVKWGKGNILTSFEEIISLTS